MIIKTPPSVKEAAVDERRITETLEEDRMNRLERRDTGDEGKR